MVWIKILTRLSEVNLKFIAKRPENCFRAAIHKLVNHKIFDNTITVLVGLNMIFLCLEFHGAPDWYIEVLEFANLTFVALFAFEAILKIIGSGFEAYF
jgi:hypothetical protein